MMILEAVFLLVFTGGVRSYVPDVVCPVATLYIHQLEPSKYVYGVFYTVPKPIHRSARFSWQVSDGKMIGSSRSRQLIVDTSGVTAEKIIVTLKMRWKNPGFKCEQTLTDTIHLRRLIDPKPSG